MSRISRCLKDVTKSSYFITTPIFYVNASKNIFCNIQYFLFYFLIKYLLVMTIEIKKKIIDKNMYKMYVFNFQLFISYVILLLFK